MPSIRAPRHQHPELGGDHVQPFGDIFTDLRHLAAAAGTLCAGGLDHPLDPGQMRRQMAAVSPGLAGRFHALPPQRCLDLGQAGFQQGVFAGKIDGIHGTK